LLGKAALLEKAKQQLFARALEHAIEHVAKEALGDLLMRACRSIDKRAFVVKLLQEAFLKQEAHQRGDGRVGQISAGAR